MNRLAITPAAPRLIDDPRAPEVYASNFSGIQLCSGNAVITFESSRADHSAGNGLINRVVVARVVMPISVAQSLVLQLHGLIDRGGSASAAAAKDIRKTQ